jgi:hypothetical protein
MMDILERIRLYFYQSVLKQRSANRPRRSIVNLDDAKTVGILYDSTDPASDKIITQFSDMLLSKGKAVEVLAFVNDKKVESKGSLAIFNPKGVNWYGIPTDERVLAFSAKSFDLLICALTEESKALEYIAYISRAKYRVGPFDERKTHCYDLMIEVGIKKDLTYLLQQMQHFLASIKYQ